MHAFQQLTDCSRNNSYLSTFYTTGLYYCDYTFALVMIYRVYQND